MTSPMKPSISTGMMAPSYGAGYGVSQNKFWKPRAVMSGEYGIYPAKGEWDNELDDSDEIDDLDIKIVSKAFSSFKQLPNDTKASSGNRKDHGSYGHLGVHNLVSHNEIQGNLLREFIKESLKESSISGRSYVKKSLGDPYYQDGNDIGSGINRAKVSPNVRSVQLPGTTASGTKYMNQVNTEENDFEDIDDELSSFDLWMIFDIDKDNLNKHSKRKY